MSSTSVGGPVPGVAPPHPVREVLDGMGRLLDTAADPPLWSLSAAEVAELLRDGYTTLARLQGLLVDLVAHADTVDVGAASGAPSTAAWLVATTGLRPAAAHATVATARAVHGPLTATGQALREGRIGADAAAVIVHAVADLPGGHTGPAAGAAEAVLLQHATDLEPTALTRLGRRVLQVVDPDGADARLGESLERDEARLARRQYLTVTPDGTGGTWLRGRLAAETSAALRAVLDPLAAPRPAADGVPDTRPADRRRADALGEACRRLLDTATLPATGGQAAQVVVTVDLATLRSGHGAATLLPDGDPVSPAMARRWACDAGVLPVVLGTAGQPLDLGRTSRLFHGALRRALELRDGGCAFPGCDRPPRWCDGHHITPWYDGGPTSLDNGVLLCGHHHRLIHGGAWSVRIAADGHPEFLPPPWLDPHQHPRRNPRPPPLAA